MDAVRLKEYVSKAKELELSCYQQEMLCNNLNDALVQMERYRTRKLNSKQEITERITLGERIGSGVMLGLG